METEDNDRDGENEFNEPVPLLELKRTVFVRMFNPGPQTPEEKAKECESFLRDSDDSMVIKRMGPEAKSEKRKKNPKGFNYRLVFSTDAEAEKVSFYLNTSRSLIENFSLYSSVLKSTRSKRSNCFPGQHCTQNTGKE